MNTKEILGDQFEKFIQIIKTLVKPTDQFWNQVAVDPNVAIDTIDDLFSRIKDIVDDIKYDIDNKNQFDLDYLINIRDFKIELVAIRAKLIEKTNEEVKAARDLIAQIEQIQ